MGYQPGPLRDESLAELACQCVFAVLLLGGIFWLSARLPTEQTVEHDGHRWVRTLRGGIAHHPDCPCQMNKAEVE